MTRSSFLLGAANYVSTTPRGSETRNRWTVPRIAHNCTLSINPGTLSLSYQVLAPFDMLPRAPITKGMGHYYYFRFSMCVFLLIMLFFYYHYYHYYRIYSKIVECDWFPGVYLSRNRRVIT